MGRPRRMGRRDKGRARVVGSEEFGAECVENGTSHELRGE